MLSRADLKLCAFAVQSLGSERNGLSILAWGGGNSPRPIGVHRGKFVRRFFDGEHLPVA